MSHAAPAACEDVAPTPDFSKTYANTWGIDYHNTRFQPASTVNAKNVRRLKIKWAYGLSTSKPRSYPLVTADSIIIGDSGRGIVALDRETGCTRWISPVAGEIASAISLVRSPAGDRLLFMLREKGLFALDAATGKSLWHVSPDNEPEPMFSGSPLVWEDAVFVPLSSREVGLAMNPLYECCKTSGGMAAFDVEGGALRWYTPTIEEEARPTGPRLVFGERFGPSGAPVWGAPMLDPTRGLLYFGTGQNYSHPTTDTSDAIFAVDMDNGAVRWVRQFTDGDAYNMSCFTRRHPNCPDPTGPDYDFGAPPVLVTLEDGSQLVVAGQKSGDVYAMDPGSGERRWSARIGFGGALGGIHWGLAVNEALGLIFVPVSDRRTYSAAGEPSPGLHALDAASGKLRWSNHREPSGISAAIVATNDIVLAGGLDGVLEAYRATNGEKLWSFDTRIDFDTVNRVPAHGGAIDAHGPFVADDLVMISSGYSGFRQTAGNAFIVLQVDEHGGE